MTNLHSNFIQQNNIHVFIYWLEMLHHVVSLDDQSKSQLPWAWLGYKNITLQDENVKSCYILLVWNGNICPANLAIKTSQYISTLLEIMF